MTDHIVQQNELIPIIEHDGEEVFTGSLIKVSSRDDLKALPVRSKNGGHIYLVEFSDGTVKAGKSINPQSRMSQHYGESIRYGLEPTRVWVSPEHKNYSENETIAMKICAKHGQLSGGREYFAGDGLFDEVKKHIEALEFIPGGAENTLSIREWIQDFIEAEHAQYELVDLKERLGETPELLIGLLGLIFQEDDDPQRFHDWNQEQDETRSYDDQLKLLDSYIRIAQSNNMSATEFLQKDRFDEVEHIINRTVSMQIEVLRLKAKIQGLRSLFEPIRETVADAAESVGL